MGLVNPITAQPVQFPGWKAHGCACKQCIFGSCKTSTFNAMDFDEYLFTCRCEKEDKMAQGFQILRCYWSFSSDNMALKGLKLPVNVFIWRNGPLADFSKTELSSFARVVSILLFPFLRQPMPYAQSSPDLHLWYLFYCSHFSDSLCHMLRALQICICDIYFTVPISQTA